MRKITKILLRANLYQAYRLIESRRKTKLARARKIAFSLRDLPLPRVKEDKIPANKLERRYNKVVRLRERIDLHLPVVLTNADNLV
ncbi:MAG: hypothetical protein WA364_27865 [Candidatus Nitrosopolaris sp.]